jgi:hypothetical protein
VAAAPFNSALGRFLRRIDHRPVADQTDSDLLARFVAARDETAFTALLRRHGPLVLGVCRRLLRDFNDADDVFQATFLVVQRNKLRLFPQRRFG